MTGNPVTDVIIMALSVFGFTVMVASEYLYYRERRKGRRK